MVTASTMDEARKMAARLLGTAEDALELDVQGVKRGGFLGLGAPLLVVRARLPAADVEVAS